MNEQYENSGNSMSQGEVNRSWSFPSDMVNTLLTNTKKGDFGGAIVDLNETNVILLKRIEELERRLGVENEKMDMWKREQEQTLKLKAELAKRLQVSGDLSLMRDLEDEDEEPKASRKFRKVTEETK